jgi:hypothetical protein
MEEQELIYRLKQGDRTAFRYIVDKYQDAILNYCFRFVKNKEVAEDLTQDVFIEVVRSVKSFRMESSDYGNALLGAISPDNAQKIKNLVALQKPYLLEIVERRNDAAVLLRKYIAGETADSAAVISLMKRYGELDGEIIYSHAVCFAEVYKSITEAQKDTLKKFRKQILGDFAPAGAFLYATPIPIPEIPNTDFLFSSATSVETKDSGPESYVLMQNFPNPFNPVTTIRYQLPERTRVNLSVYSILGQKIAELVNDNKEAGSYRVTFDASQLSSGVYLYRLQTDKTLISKKLMLIK